MTHITPDHPDYAAIVKTITPIHRVKKEAFPKTYFDAEQVPCKNGQRHESEEL